MKRILAFLFFVVLPNLTYGENPTLTVNTDEVKAHISPMIYGLMTEEINHSYDGGLYAEMIRNRNFRENDRLAVHWAYISGTALNLVPVPANPRRTIGSGAVTSGSGSIISGSAVISSSDTAADTLPVGPAQIALDETDPVPDTELTTCLKLDASAADAGHRVGVANEGYWGIPVRPNTNYRASFYAKARGDIGPLTICIEPNNGGAPVASAQIPSISAEWKKYTVTLSTGPAVAVSASNRFVITVEKPGTCWFNLVSLFPPTFNDRPNGNRIDIMQLLIDMHPSFLRLPGGNFLEGPTIADRFPWKQTLGPIEQRPGHVGSWGYRPTDGMGLLEFLEWCEDIHVEPVLAVYAGYSLHGMHVNPGSDLQPFVDDALDEIEYVTGDKTTKWGAERAKNGHPNPFPLHYVEIGNEDGSDGKASYDGRFTQFFDAIKKKYPSLQCISTVGGRDWAGARDLVKSRIPDVVDEHFYCSFLQMLDIANRYDVYPRTGPKIFVGEWATREGGPTTNLLGAIGDAAWMAGMERNADIVIMASYAPLFVNVNPHGMQWKSNLIGFDALTSYGSPSYYVQKVFAENIGDEVLQTKAENISTRTYTPRPPRVQAGQPSPTPLPAKQVPTLFYSATRSSKTGVIFLKLVNGAADDQTVDINIDGKPEIIPEGKEITITSQHSIDTNSIDTPTKVIPGETNIGGLGRHFSEKLAAYSVKVLALKTR